MKVPSRTLSAAVAMLRKLCAGQTLSSKYLRVEGAGALSLTATDLYAALRVEVAVDARFPAMLLDAAALAKALPGSKAKEVDVVLDGSGLRVGAFRLAPATPVEDYPVTEFHDPGEAPVTGAWLDALAYVRPACSEDKTRYNMCGVWHDARAPRVAATDTHRLYLAPVDAPLAGLPAAGAIMPAGLADVLLGARKLAHTWRGSFAGGRFSFAGEGDGVRVRVAGRAIEGQFPPFDSVVPRADRDRVSVSVPCAELIETLLAGAKALPRGTGILVDADNEGLTLATPDGCSSAYRAEVAVEDGDLAKPIAVMYMPHYVAGALAGERALLSWDPKDFATAPLRIDLTDGRLAVVMPMRR